MRREVNEFSVTVTRSEKPRCNCVKTKPGHDLYDGTSRELKEPKDRAGAALRPRLVSPEQSVSGRSAVQQRGCEAGGCGNARRDQTLCLSGSGCRGQGPKPDSFKAHLLLWFPPRSLRRLLHCFLQLRGFGVGRVPLVSHRSSPSPVSLTSLTSLPESPACLFSPPSLSFACVLFD